MKDELSDELVTNLREESTLWSGKEKSSRRFVLEAPDIKRLRARYKLSRRKLAGLLGMSVVTFRRAA